MSRHHLPESSPTGYSVEHVLPVMRWGEWSMVAGLVLLYELASARPILISNRAAGVPLAGWHVFVVSAVDGVLWFALVPALFAALDRTPLRAPRVLENLLARVAVGVAIMGVEAAALTGILVTLGGGTELGEIVRSSPLLGFEYQFETNAPPLLLLSLAYAVLLRVHAVRREHRVASALQASLVEARLHALLVELQPHFLFNTLNGIAALIREDPPTAESMLIQLSDLLRLTADVGQPAEIPLELELERLRLYLGIQRMRFGPRLVIREHVDAGAARALVPPLILQPIVENALTHGLGPRRGPGVVEVACERQDDWVILRVSDDGVGLREAPVRERVGIGNTRARLAAMFGEHWRLDLSPRLAGGGGTTVTIAIPFRAAPGVGDAVFGLEAGRSPSHLTPIVQPGVA